MRLVPRGRAMLVEPGEVLARLAADVPCVAGGPAGELIGLLPLFRDRSQPQEFGVKFGGVGLDARLVTDLSKLEPNKLITPNELAYIRTEMPAAAAEATAKGPWMLDASGLVAQPAALRLDELARQSKNRGPHLFECSGNGNPANFGLMSVAEWEGVALTEVVARLKPSKDATGILVSGFDHVGQNSQRSIVGASWVFPLASLDALGAFLAVRMNGEPVPADHGKPVRLVVPGLVRLHVDQVGQRDQAGGSRRTGHHADGRVRKPHSPDRTTQARSRLHTRGHSDRGHSGTRRKTQGIERPRIPHRRHCLGWNQGGTRSCSMRAMIGTSSARSAASRRSAVQSGRSSSRRRVSSDAPGALPPRSLMPHR